MAFQMIPPRVSSSPPPLDSLPSVACSGDDDEDDEFGNFTTHNNTFDITGLSDKLPPTPVSSPSKLPVAGDDSSEKNNSTSNQTEGLGNLDVLPKAEISSNSGAVSDIKIHGGLESSTGSISGFNGEDVRSFEIKGEDDEDFGDFSSFCTSTEAAGGMQSGTSDDCQEIGVSSIDSSQKCDVMSRIGDNSPNDSVNSFSMIATPPPLDHVVDSVVIDDEFCRISPNPPPEIDDDFGDFTACTFDDSRSELSAVVNDNESGEVSKGPDSCEEASFEGCQTLPSSTFVASDVVPNVNEINGTNVDCHVSDEQLAIDRTKNLEKVEDCAGDSESCRSIHKTECGDVGEVGKDKSDISSTIAEASAGKDVLLDCGLPGVETENTKDCEAFSNFQSSIVQSLHSGDSADSVQPELERSNVSREDIQEISACKSSENLSSEDIRTDTKTDEIPVLQKNLDLVEGEGPVDIVQENGQGDSEFGDFSKAKDDDNDDDDLDFGDLREQVRSGAYGMGQLEDDADDFGEFYEYEGMHTSSQVPVLNEDDDKFAAFETHAPEVEGNEDFGDFAKVRSEDDFGSFAAPECEVSSKGVGLEGTVEDDEFGDFTSQKCEETQPEKFKVTWHETSSATSSTDNPVLRKLESLILKWIPVETSAGLSLENQENHTVPTLFQSIEDDAFVWHQLENLEASTALTLSWGNTQAQTLYLSSVNVDARNILFGQKWSSSVPLFAQTLSFSPLTPAKPPENGGVLESGNRGSVSPPVLSSSIIPKFNATSFNKVGNEVEIPSVNENTPETMQRATGQRTAERKKEQIPPAKFDWTSSGLTNPLEGPAYNSSLFDMDLLLSNSEIGKGATNALLASLEREFLSEGEEKGALSHIKNPPAPSPLVQQILGSGMNSTPSATTPLQSMSSDLREVVEQLPKIDFMRSRVLMFPIRGDE